MPHAPETPPPPHDSPFMQVPQESVAPHPSPVLPHASPCWTQVFGVQVVPHSKGRPAPPQVCPVGQSPQDSMAPHPSLMRPQLAPPSKKSAQILAAQLGGMYASLDASPKILPSGRRTVPSPAPAPSTRGMDASTLPPPSLLSVKTELLPLPPHAAKANAHGRATNLTGQRMLHLRMHLRYELWEAMQ